MKPTSRPPDPRYRRLRQLFDKAVEVPAAERERFVREAAQHEPSIADELVAMLAAAEAPSEEVHRPLIRVLLLQLHDLVEGLHEDCSHPAGETIGALCQRHPTLRADLLGWLAQLSTDDESPPTVAARTLAEDSCLRELPLVCSHRVLDPYVLIRFVGKGGFGRVYRARHLRLGSDVAIKFVHFAFADSPEAFPRFEREARLGATMRSDHLVKVTDCNRRDGLQYMVMEWVDGEDLANRVDRLGPRPVDEAVQLLHGLAKGLAVVHEHAVVHRDVKPANVMLTRQGVVKLADLGLARHAQDTRFQRSVTPIGTPAFMAPEQFQGLREAGAPADVYAAGATAYYLLTGQVPPRRLVADEVLPLPALDGYPLPLVRLIERCIAVPFGERIADGQRLLAQVRRVVAERGIHEQLDEAAVGLPHDVGRDLIDDQLLVRIRSQLSIGALKPRPVPVAESEPRRPWPWLAGLAATSLTIVAVRTWAVDPAPVQRSNASVVSVESRASPERGAPQTTLTPVIERVRVMGPSEAATSIGPAAYRLPATPFGETILATLAIAIDGELSDPDRIVVDADARNITQERPSVDARECTVVLHCKPGSYAATVRLGASQQTLWLDVPCVPHIIEGLELAAKDHLTGVHYLLPTPGAPPLRFVWVEDGLLAGVTEVSREHFRAFVDSDRYEPLLASDAAFMAWLGERNSIEQRRRHWREVLTEPVQDLPITGMHASEAAAFARWLSVLLPAMQVRVSTSALWRTIANRNCERPPTAAGDYPFPGGLEVANFTAATSTPTEGPDGTLQESSSRGLETIWSRRQGVLPLYHIGGNAEEMCIDAYAGDSPLRYALLGGSHASPDYAMRLPSTSQMTPWDVRAANARQLRLTCGFRLTITPKKE